MTTSYKPSILDDFRRPHPRVTKWTKRIGLVFLGFAIGGMVYQEPGPKRIITKEVQVPVEKTVTKEVKVSVPTTPDSCRQVLEIDNQMFQTIADGMRDLDFEGLADDIKDKTSGRTALYAACVSA